MEKEIILKKTRSKEEQKKLINRLSRIEGQVRGIKKMVEEDSYCIDILTQCSAASAAISAFSKEVLTNHIKSCVKEDIKKGSDEKVDELLKMLEKLMK